MRLGDGGTYEGELARLDHERESRVDVVGGLLLALLDDGGDSHCTALREPGRRSEGGTYEVESRITDEEKSPPIFQRGPTFETRVVTTDSIRQERDDVLQDYCFAKVTFILRSSAPYFVLCNATLAVLDESSSAYSTNAIPLRPAIIRTSTRFGYLISSVLYPT